MEDEDDERASTHDEMKRERKKLAITFGACAGTYTHTHTQALGIGTDICTTLNVNKYVQYWLVFF